MSVTAVLFDFDGTLADTLPVSFQAFQEVFAKYDGRSLTEKEVVAMFGPTEDEILQRRLQNRQAVPEAIQDYYEIYKQGHEDGVPHNPEITELLAELKRQGIQIGVVTGKSRKAFDISSEALGLSDLFDATITGDDVEQPKPDPEGVRKALELLSAVKDEAVFLGDSNADVQAGKAAGLRTFAVQWLSVSQSSTFESTPDGIFHEIGEFLTWLHADNAL